MSSKTKITATKEEVKPTLVPKLRFPEFREAEGWDESPLGELMEITSSKRVHESDWTASGVPFYRAREIVALNNMEPISPLYISEKLYGENAKRSGEIAEGDLLITGVGSIGIPYLVKANDRFYFKDGNIIWLKNRGSKLLGRFLHLLYGTQFVQRQIKVMAGVGTVGTYTIDNANRTSVVFPTDEAEQQKIAECLSSVAALIAAQARKVDALKTHKKALMQQLFPREGETQPHLRFPEFQNAREWEVRTIGEMFDLVNGCAFNPEDWKPSGTPIIRIQNLNAPSAEFNYSQSPVPERNRVEPGDLLFAWSGTLGSSFGARIWNGPSGVLNQHIFKVLMDEQQITLKFALLVLARVEEDIARRTHGFKASFVHVKKSDLVKVELQLPPLPEQQRIAACLSSLDALITAETQKHEVLKTHKRGLMQQLFPSPEEVEA